MALPTGVTTTTLSLGPYTDAEGDVQFEGMVGFIAPSSPVRHIATGAVIVSQPVKVVIGQGGVGSVVLPQTDQAGIAPSPFTYTLAWQAGRFDSTPGNLTFALPVAAGPTVDFDTLIPTPAGVSVPTGVVSVNGKSGVVSLTAADVGAAPAGSTGSVASVNAKTGTVVLSASDVGADAAGAATAAVAAEVTRADGKYLATAQQDSTTATLVGTPASSTAAALKAAYVPKWQPSTAYTAGDVVLNPSGQTVTANATFTSGTTYSASNWTVVSGGGSGAGLPSTVVNRTTAYTAAAGDFVQADTTSAGFTVTLPAAPAAGALVAVKKVSADTNTLTIAPSGGGTIDGSATQTTVTQWAGLVVEHVGSNVWRVAASMTMTGPAGTNGTNGAISSVQDEGSAMPVRSKLNFVGTAVALTDDAANDRTLVTVTGGAGSAGLLPRAHRTGKYVTTPGQVNSYTAGRGYTGFFPFEVYASTTYTQAALNVVTAVPSCVGRVGIYSDNGGVPGTLLFEPTATTTLDLSTAGQKTTPTFSQPLAAGIYWIAFLAVGGAGDPVLSGTQYSPVVISSSTIAGAVQNSCSGYADAGGNSGLPTAAASLTQSTITPRVALLVA